MQGMGSPFDPSQFRLPTLGFPPGLGIPEPTPEVEKEYGQLVEREIAPENTIQVVVGRAKVLVLHQKPRRIYAPDESIAAIQIVTDQELAIVGKKQGTTVLNLWFPDPDFPIDPQKDRTLSYLVVVLSDPERAAMEVLAERKRLEAQVKAFEQALKVLEQEIKQAFPDSAVRALARGRTGRGPRRVQGYNRGRADSPHCCRTFAHEKTIGGNSVE